MSYALKNRRMTPEEFLAFDRAVPEGEKYEFLDGEVVPWSGNWQAMAGGSTSHSRIAGNVFAFLHAQLRGKPCEPFGSDHRVDVPGGNYVYPDVFVACEPRYADAELDTISNPVVIFEVLSPSTARRDRTTKFNRYRQAASLQDYVLIEQDFVSVTHHRRAQDGQHWWTRVLESPAEELVLDAIGCLLTLSEIYERVQFAPDETTESPTEQPTNNQP